MDGDLVTVINELQRRPTFAALTQGLQSALDMVGVKRFSYHHQPPPGAFDRASCLNVFAIGFPDDWVETYQEEELYKHDPIPKRAAASTRPFFWSECTAEPGSKAAEYLGRLYEACLGDGLAVPVCGPHGRNGYVGLGCAEGRCPWTADQRIFMHYVSQAGHLRYCELLTQKLPSATVLSERENEILRWIAQGKSNAVIADILELSPNTVDTYTRRIFKKLKVVDRVTASLRGFALGFLD
jgi:LuxR family transcriptional regulator/LuxR family quorum-sensing system transcriptional regulator CciR